MVCNILPCQDASTHLIWNSYFKEYRSFGPDLMPILETRSEVKVTVTGKWNVTIRHFKMHSHTKLPSKMHLHTKFGIPILDNVRDMPQTRILKTILKVNVTNMVRDTPPSQDAFPHQIWNFYIKEYKRYAPDSKQFLETRSEVKVNVTGTKGWCATLYHPKMHQHTKFGIPTSNNIGGMLRTRLF